MGMVMVEYWERAGTLNVSVTMQLSANSRL